MDHLPPFAVPVTADWQKKFFQSFSPRQDAQDPVVSHRDFSDIRYIAQPSPTGHFILERDEYAPLWQHIHTARERKLSSHYEAAFGGLVVWGQPGIGKSFFLYYALAHAISCGIYIVLSEEPSQVVIFDHKYQDPYIVPATSFHVWQPEDWALVLVNYTPPTKFTLDESRVFVVQATPPGGDYWPWAKQRGAMLWRVGPVSRGEFHKLSILRDTLTPSQPSQAHPCDTSAATTTEKTDNVDLDLGRYLSEIETLFPTTAELVNTLRIGRVAKEEQREYFHRYFFAFAADDRNPRGYDNTGHQYVVPTRYLRDRIARMLPGKQFQEQLDAVVLFAPAPQLAWAMLESLMPQILLNGATPVSCIFYETNLNTVVPANLPMAETLFDSDSTSFPALDTLHIPWAGFPSLDAFWVHELGDIHEVVMLQATMARSHSVSPRGIRSLQTVLAKYGDISYKHIFVVPSAEVGEAVVRPYAPWGAQISRSMAIPVGYAVIELPDSFDTSLAAFLARDVLDIKPEQESPVVEASTTVSGDDAPTSPAKRKPEDDSSKSEDSVSKKARVGGCAASEES